MDRYRAYLIDSHDNVRDARDIDAGCDEIAVARAWDLARAVAVELWKQDEFICRFDPAPEAESAMGEVRPVFIPANDNRPPFRRAG